MSTDAGRWPQPPVVFGEWEGAGTDGEPDAPRGSVGPTFPLFLPPEVDVGVEVEAEVDVSGHSADGGSRGDAPSTEVPSLGAGEEAPPAPEPIQPEPEVEIPVGWGWGDGEVEAQEPLAEPLETAEAAAEAPAEATTEATADGTADASWEFAPSPEDAMSPAAEELEAEATLESEASQELDASQELESIQESGAIQEVEAVREPGALEESEGVAELEAAGEETPTSVGPERQLTAGTAGTWVEEESEAGPERSAFPGEEAGMASLETMAETHGEGGQRKEEAGDPGLGHAVVADAVMGEVIGEEFEVVEAVGDAEGDTLRGGGAPTAEAPPLPGPSEEVAVLLERLAEELRRTGDIPFDPEGRESTRLEGLLRGMLAGYLAHLRGGDR
jgi:hypothetical protein